MGTYANVKILPAFYEKAKSSSIPKGITAVIALTDCSNSLIELVYLTN
jgi:hypothetical protein